jgi:two-component system, NarL family, sensor histidine kinase DegS
MNDRSLLRSRRRPRHWTDMRHALAVEETLANVRLVLLAVSLATVVPLHYGRDVAVIAAMIAVNLCAAAIVVALRFGWIRKPEHIVALHAADLVGAIFLTLHTGGVASPYSTIYLFALLAAGYRWGRLEVGLTCIVSVAALTVHAIVAHLFGWPEAPDPPFVLLRLAYLGMGGVLIGFMAGVERRQRMRTVTASRILSLIGSHSSVVTAVHLLVNELLDLVSASHLVLVVQEEGRDLVTVWQAERSEEESRRHRVKVAQASPKQYPMYVFSVPDKVAGWLVTRNASRRGADGTSVTALGHDGHEVPGDFSIGPLLDTPFPWSRALVLSYQVPQGMRARVFMFLPAGVRASRLELRDVQDIMRDVGPALVNLYLQRRLQSRSAVVERTRISRELHDGVIQSLIGVEMQLEVTRRQAEGQVPPSVTNELAHIQRIIGQEVLNVRDLMQLLKPMDVDAARLVEYLASVVDQFRQRTGIKASFACGVDEIDLSPHVCREVAGIVQEALANVRKHAEATSVLVRLDTDDGDWRVTIDDNGRGLDFEGYLSPAEVEAQRRGPVLIRERARSIDGRLGIHSHPGFGTKLEITIPRKHHG